MGDNRFMVIEYPMLIEISLKTSNGRLARLGLDRESTRPLWRHVAVGHLHRKVPDASARWELFKMSGDGFSSIVATAPVCGAAFGSIMAPDTNPSMPRSARFFFP
jgi:hypothetical protein